MPQPFTAMRADYAAWAQANGVLAMPEGYSPVKQVFINSIVNYWMPTYGLQSLAVLVLLLGLPAALMLRARRRRAR